MKVRTRFVSLALIALVVALVAAMSPASALLPGEWSIPAPINGDPNQPAMPLINENGFQWALAPAGGTANQLPINLFALRLEVPGDLITIGNVSVPFSYGIAGVQMRTNTKVSDITQLSVDTYYEQSTAGGGSCGGGSPRYQLKVDLNDNGKPDPYPTDRNIFVYPGPYPNFIGCTFGVWSHENLLDGQLRFDSTQLGGPFYGDQASAVAQAAGHNVLFVTLVWDSYWLFPGRSIFWADNLRVNDFLLAEPGVSHVCSLLAGQGHAIC